MTSPDVSPSGRSANERRSGSPGRIPATVNFPFGTSAVKNDDPRPSAGNRGSSPWVASSSADLSPPRSGDKDENEPSAPMRGAANRWNGPAAPLVFVATCPASTSCTSSSDTPPASTVAACSTCRSSRSRLAPTSTRHANQARTTVIARTPPATRAPIRRGERVMAPGGYRPLGSWDPRRPPRSLYRPTPASRRSRGCRPSTSAGDRSLLRGGLLLLLEPADLRQRLGPRDVGDRPPRAVHPVVAGRLAPAGRCDSVLLAEQGHEDLRLLRAEAWQLADPLQQGGAVRGVGPQVVGATVVALHQQAAELLRPAGHRSGVAVQGRRALEDAGELVSVRPGQLGGVEAVDAETVGQQPRCAEGALHRELLVEQHPDQECERVAAQQVVGRGVLGDAERGHAEHRAGRLVRRHHPPARLPSAEDHPPPGPFPTAPAPSAPGWPPEVRSPLLACDPVAVPPGRATGGAPGPRSA